MWLDTSEQSPEETIDEILSRRSETLVDDRHILVILE